MGLNDSFNHVRSQILFMNPIPNVNKAYSLLIEEEQRQAKISGLNVEQQAAFVGVRTQNFSANQKRKDYNIVCDHCKRPSHKKSQCYKIIGYPPNFKFNKNKNQGYSSNLVIQQEDKADFTGSSHNSVVDTATTSSLFTEEQYQHILKLLSKDDASSSSGSVKGVANMAGSLKWEGMSDW